MTSQSNAPINMPPHPTPMTQWFRLAFWSALLVVGLLSLTPVEHLPTQVFNIWDKAQHASGFAALTLLGQRAYRSSLATLVLGLTIYGALIELAQMATGWRHGDIRDWLADAVGIVTGLSLSLLIQSPDKANSHDAQ